MFSKFAKVAIWLYVCHTLVMELEANTRNYMVCTPCREICRHSDKGIRKIPELSKVTLKRRAEQGCHMAESVNITTEIAHLR